MKTANDFETKRGDRMQKSRTPKRENASTDDRELENTVRAAFDAVRMPKSLAAQTVAFIENQTAAETPAALTKADATKDSEFDKSLKAARGRRSPLQVVSSWGQAASRYAAVVAVICVLGLGGGIGGYVAYATEIATVDITSTMGVTIGVNCFGTVVRVETDAELDPKTLALVESVRGGSFDAALETLLAIRDTDGTALFENTVDIQVACGNAAQRQSLEKQSGECLGRQYGKNGGGNRHGAHSDR